MKSGRLSCMGLPKECPLYRVGRCGFLKKVALYLFLVDIAYRHVSRNSSNSVHLPGGKTDGKSHPNMAADRPP